MASISVKAIFTTAVTTLTTVQTMPPRLSSPPPLHVCCCCGGELYCTITLTLFAGFEISGRRSGEILEVSAMARAIVNKATTAYRESLLKATEIACMASVVRQLTFQVSNLTQRVVRKDSYGSRNPRHDAPNCLISQTGWRRSEVSWWFTRPTLARRFAGRRR